MRDIEKVPEPFAWVMQWPNHSPSFTTDKSDYVSWFAGKASYPDGLEALYTEGAIRELLTALTSAQEESEALYGALNALAIAAEKIGGVA